MAAVTAGALFCATGCGKVVAKVDASDGAGIDQVGAESKAEVPDGTQDAARQDVASDVAPDAAQDVVAAVDGGGGASDGAKAALGASCNGNAQCASGFCVDGVCCNTGCNGVCEQCSSTGTCEAAVDDNGCAQISCSGQSTDCKAYADITTNRCKARGQCKTAADCTAQNKPARTSCGSVDGGESKLICDGAGRCIHPSVKCGATNCEIEPQWCNSITDNQLCAAGSAFNMPARIHCDETADCAVGSVCCEIGSCSGGDDVLCVPAGSCVTTYCISRVQVCNPLVSGECEAGTCTPVAASSRLPPGYYECQ